MIRVLIADDSRAARALLRSLFDEDSGIQVVGEAADGETAVAEVQRLKPDVVTMDIHMPLLDGLEATARLMNESPLPIVIVSSSVSSADVASSMNAMKTGAVVALPKPGSGSAPLDEEDRREFVNTVKAMAQVKVVRRWSGSYRVVGARGAPPEQQNTSAPPGSRHQFTASGIGSAAEPRPKSAPPVNLVAIAASTGGPSALQQLLASLPVDFPVPILLVQHIARGFLPGFATWLGNECSLRVEIAAHGTIAEPGTIHVAPDDVHLGINPLRRLQLTASAPVNGFRPSASVLFDASADAVGAALVAVIMTGMGSDGVSGLRKVRAKGGYVIAQNEATSLIYGMPGEAVNAGLANAVLPLEDIASQLLRLATR